MVQSGQIPSSKLSLIGTSQSLVCAKNICDVEQVAVELDFEPLAQLAAWEPACTCVSSHSECGGCTAVCRNTSLHSHRMASHFSIFHINTFSFSNWVSTIL